MYLFFFYNAKNPRMPSALKVLTEPAVNLPIPALKWTHPGRYQAWRTHQRKGVCLLPQINTRRAARNATGANFHRARAEP